MVGFVLIVRSEKVKNMKFDFFDYEWLDYLEEEKERRKETYQMIAGWLIIICTLIFSGYIIYQSDDKAGAEITNEETLHE